MRTCRQFRTALKTVFREREQQNLAMFQHVRFYFPRLYDLQQKMERKLTAARVRRARKLCERFYTESEDLSSSWVYAHSCRWIEPQQHSPVLALHTMAGELRKYVAFAEGKIHLE